MTQWYTADLHLSHANISAYCGRPFTNTDDMNTGIIERWNAQVQPEDDVWVIGDVAMGKIADSLPLVGLLNGIKRLRTGNHDRCAEMHGKRAAGWTEKYLDAGFVEVVHGHGWLSFGAVVSHFPYAGDSGDEDRYIDERPPDRGRWLVHGHVHEKWRQNGRQINVGLDAWGGCLVAEEEVISLIHAGPQNFPRIEWEET